ncbi:hypothetical protein CLV98_11116 [Dyadobacter jejuensis]|uniref:WD40 repeat protein n=1 Tax=Dyadobacter jejuensis TaxID=1082580 RepID=A0A316AG04_9BACT|nr:hypothetical protein CLV98_11116 [Dyadobacter jejuensis]
MKSLFTTCQFDQKVNHTEKVGSQYKIRKIGRLPTAVPESSGLAMHRDGTSFWTHNDSGGEASLFRIDQKGALIERRDIPHATNRDWEELAQGPDGALFIGDMGNNGNSRKDLTIYKIQSPRAGQPIPPAEKIEFSYPDQKTFPPAPEDFNFDCEAFFYSNDSLYLFSKNRSKTKLFVKLYRIPATPGKYTATLVDSLAMNSQITAADRSPDGKTFALLTYSKVLLFAIPSGRVNFDTPNGCFKFFHKQSEALVFLNNTDLLATNEQGQIFKITRR